MSHKLDSIYPSFSSFHVITQSVELNSIDRAEAAISSTRQAEIRWITETIVHICVIFTGVFQPGKISTNPFDFLAITRKYLDLVRHYAFLTEPRIQILHMIISP